jgi:hypothetical protein
MPVFIYQKDTERRVTDAQETPRDAYRQQRETVVPLPGSDENCKRPPALDNTGRHRQGWRDRFPDFPFGVKTDRQMGEMFRAHTAPSSCTLSMTMFRSSS